MVTILKQPNHLLLLIFFTFFSLAVHAQNDSLVFYNGMSLTMT